MIGQRHLRFQLPALPGESAFNGRANQRDFNRFDLPFQNTVPTAKLLADCLKRQARAVMRDLTECPPESIPSQLARLRDIEETANLVMSHGLVEEHERRLSGMQLAHPTTLMDFCAALDVTRQQHRAPCFVAPSQEQLDRIERKLDLLAGWIGGAHEI